MFRKLKSVDLMGVFNKVSVFAFVAAAVIFGYNFLFLGLSFVEAFKPVYFVALGFAVVTSLMFISWALREVFRDHHVGNRLVHAGLALLGLVPVVLIVFNVSPIVGLILFAVGFFAVFLFCMSVAAFFRAFM